MARMSHSSPSYVSRTLNWPQPSRSGFPAGSDGKESAYNAGDPGPIPGSGRSPGEGKGNPPQYSCLETPMDRGAWGATVHGVAESDRTEQFLLSLHFFNLTSGGLLISISGS